MVEVIHRKVLKETIPKLNNNQIPWLNKTSQKGLSKINRICQKNLRIM